MAELILGLETSCDETAAAVISDDGAILSNVISSQAQIHARYGGVVPEVASRRHLELVEPVVADALEQAGAALEDVSAIGVTQGPGLVGALLVGLSYAKGLSWASGVPLVPVDHLRGHVASLFLGEEPLAPPFLCLLASGGHTLLLIVHDYDSHEVIGGTRDDAAGEAFDKGARLLGLGYPGGPALDRLARTGDATAYRFPIARMEGLDFSFSGVKTALLYAVRDLSDAALAEQRADLAASYERAIVQALLQRIEQAAENMSMETIAVVGGVAANSALRAGLLARGVRVAPLALCTDNGAMIASAARYAPKPLETDYLSIDAYSSR
jgi:N6-L-threonylcarbamoyladenine synthase